MSEERKPEPIILPEHPQPAAVHTNHYCEHSGCKKWGSFGFGTGTKQRWYWW